MLGPFRVRNLRRLPSQSRGALSHGLVKKPSLDSFIISIHSHDYEKTISAHPSAKLKYFDDDDGELVTIGSHLELSQRLDEPVPWASDVRRSPHLIALQPNVAPLHIFEISPEEESQEVWQNISDSFLAPLEDVQDKLHSPSDVEQERREIQALRAQIHGFEMPSAGCTFTNSDDDQSISAVCDPSEMWDRENLTKEKLPANVDLYQLLPETDESRPDDSEFVTEHPVTAWADAPDQTNVQSSSTMRLADVLNELEPELSARETTPLLQSFCEEDSRGNRAVESESKGDSRTRLLSHEDSDTIPCATNSAQQHPTIPIQTRASAHLRDSKSARPNLDPKTQEGFGIGPTARVAAPSDATIANNIDDGTRQTPNLPETPTIARERSILRILTSLTEGTADLMSELPHLRRFLSTDGEEEKLSTSPTGQFATARGSEPTGDANVRKAKSHLQRLAVLFAENRMPQPNDERHFHFYAHVVLQEVVGALQVLATEQVKILCSDNLPARNASALGNVDRLVHQPLDDRPTPQELENARPVEQGTTWQPEAAGGSSASTNQLSYLSESHQPARRHESNGNIVRGSLSAADRLRRARSVRFEDLPSVIAHQSHTKDTSLVPVDLSRPLIPSWYVPSPLPLDVCNISHRGRSSDDGSNSTSSPSIYKRKSMPSLDHRNRNEGRRHSPAEPSSIVSDDEPALVPPPGHHEPGEKTAHHPRPEDHQMGGSTGIPLPYQTKPYSKPGRASINGRGPVFLASRPRCLERISNHPMASRSHAEGSQFPIRKLVRGPYRAPESFANGGSIENNNSVLLHEAGADKLSRPARIARMEFETRNSHLSLERRREWIAMRNKLETAGIPEPFEEYLEGLRRLREVATTDLTRVALANGGGRGIFNADTESLIRSTQVIDEREPRKNATEILPFGVSKSQTANNDSSWKLDLPSMPPESYHQTLFPTLEQFEEQESRSDAVSSPPSFPPLPSMEPLVPLRSVTSNGDASETSTFDTLASLERNDSIPGAWPELAELPPKRESSGDLFRRLTGITRVPNSRSPVAPTVPEASLTGSRLIRPFDAIAETATVQRDIPVGGVRRSATVVGFTNPYQASQRRPYSSCFDGRGRVDWDTFLQEANNSQDKPSRSRAPLDGAGSHKSQRTPSNQMTTRLPSGHVGVKLPDHDQEKGAEMMMSGPPPGYSEQSSLSNTRTPQYQYKPKGLESIRQQNSQLQQTVAASHAFVRRGSGPRAALEDYKLQLELLRQKNEKQAHRESLCQQGDQKTRAITDGRPFVLPRGRATNAQRTSDYYADIKVPHLEDQMRLQNSRGIEECPNTSQTEDGIGAQINLMDYEHQLMVLEQRNERRLRMMTTTLDHQTVPSVEPEVTAQTPLMDYQRQLVMLEQRNKRALRMAMAKTTEPTLQRYNVQHQLRQYARPAYHEPQNTAAATIGKTSVKVEVQNSRETPTVSVSPPTTSTRIAVPSVPPSAHAVDNSSVLEHQDATTVRQVSACVEKLTQLGFGNEKEGGAERLVVYAQATKGKFWETIDLIEEDRQASSAL